MLQLFRKAQAMRRTTRLGDYLRGLSVQQFARHPLLIDALLRTPSRDVGDRSDPRHRVATRFDSPRAWGFQADQVVLSPMVASRDIEVPSRYAQDAGRRGLTLPQPKHAR